MGKFKLTNVNTNSTLDVLTTKYPVGEIGFLLEIDEYNCLDDDYEIVTSLYTVEDVILFSSVVSMLGEKLNISKITIEYLGFGRQDKTKRVTPDRQTNKRYIEIVLSKPIFDIIFRAIPSRTKVYIVDPHNIQDAINVAHDQGTKLSIIRPTILFDEYDGIIFPDRGAYDRYPQFRNTNDHYLIFEKVREDNGYIAKHQIKESNGDIKPNGTYVVVDDICDGGATFISIAKTMRG